MYGKDGRNLTKKEIHLKRMASVKFILNRGALVVMMVGY